MSLPEDQSSRFTMMMQTLVHEHFAHEKMCEFLEISRTSLYETLSGNRLPQSEDELKKILTIAITYLPKDYVLCCLPPKLISPDAITAISEELHLEETPFWHKNAKTLTTAEIAFSGTKERSWFEERSQFFCLDTVDRLFSEGYVSANDRGNVDSTLSSMSTYSLENSVREITLFASLIKRSLFNSQHQYVGKYVKGVSEEYWAKSHSKIKQTIREIRLEAENNPGPVPMGVFCFTADIIKLTGIKED